MNEDLEHLRLLSIFHYVVAGIGALFACFPCLHLAFGLILAIAPGVPAIASGVMEHGTRGNPEIPQFIGAMMAAIAGVMILIGWTLALCVFLNARFLAVQSHVLMRPSVRSLFNRQSERPIAGH